MLREIYCEKFFCEGKIRKPIIFHQGLNTVLGSDSGSNSIGKSTFLMILDFVFGGMDYLEKSSDVHKNIGAHIICFSYEFSGKRYYFARPTNNSREVFVCDEKYNNLETISIEKYNDFLKEKYGLRHLPLTFRETVGKFFRVYLKECCDECHPLRVAARVSDKDGIIELIKIFGKYDAIKSTIETLKDIEQRHDIYKKAIRYNQIISPANKTEYKKNSKDIKLLEKDLEELAEKSNCGLLEIDSLKAKLVAGLKSDLTKLYRKRTILKSKRELLVQDSLIVPLEKDFSPLIHFFPEANLKSLAEVETFHKGVIDALQDEYKQKCDEYDCLLLMISEEIEKLEIKIKAMGSASNLSQMILDNYSAMRSRYDNLIEANKHFDEEIALKTAVAELKQRLNDLYKSEFLDIETKINEQMENYNKFIFNKDKISPVLNIVDNSHYSFEIPNDSGTGSRYKGLILFDLSMLLLTPLPVAAHDSFMLKQIEDYVLEKLLELYTGMQKQVFIAIDKQNSYTQRASELLEHSVVLRLSSDGKELFGRSWNVIDTKTE